MPPKAVLVANVLATVITLGPLGMQGNTSMAESSKYIVEQYRDMITQLVDN